MTCLLPMLAWLYSGTAAGLTNNTPKTASADAQIQHATQWIQQGKVPHAVTLLDRTLKAARKTGDNVNQVRALGLLSDCRLTTGLIQEAMDLARQAVSLSQTLDSPALTADALIYLGNAYMASGDFNAARKTYLEANYLSLQSGNLQREIDLSINLLHLELATGNIHAAIPRLKESFNQAGETAPNTRAYNLITLAYITEKLLREGTAPAAEQPVLKHEAYRALAEARALARTENDKSAHTMATGYLAELYLLEQRYAEAEQLLRQALFLALENDTHYLAGRWYWQLGRLLALTGRQPDAITAYYDALATLKDIQPVLLQGWRGYPEAFHDTVGVVYRELVQLLLAKADNASSREIRQQVLKSIRYVMEEYKAVELKVYFQDACVTKRFAENRNIELDSLITPGTAVLYPIVLRDKTVLIVSHANGDMHYVSVEVSQQEIKREARRFRTLMDPSQNPREMLKLAMSLYNKLIGPVREQLDQYGIDSLVIVPEGILRTIPFAALYDGKNYLVSRYALAISPGLLLTDTSFSGSTRQVFAGGLSEGVQGFSRLPYVREEIDTIAELYRGKKYLDNRFTKANVLSELGMTDYQWVTFATHGHIHRNFNQSYLLTYDEKLTFDELQSALRSERVRNQGVDMLVLSACDTAVGDERAALGLAGLALKAGVKSTVASLWTVNDKYTAVLIPRFLSQLKQPGITKARALQAAQLDLMSEYGASHPYYWAAFVIAGNWL